MSPTWHSEVPPPQPLRPDGVRDWLRVARRLILILSALVVGLVVLGVLRAGERVLGHTARPWSSWVPVHVSRACLACLGLSHQVQGAALKAQLVVANHSSWLDILVLNAVGPLAFVAKADVATWPGIGLLARVTGTVFISRDPRHAKHEAEKIAAKLSTGMRLLLFPEGTSTDGRRVVSFRSSMFAGMVAAGVPTAQAISVCYKAPARRDPRFYGWWGDMELEPSLLQALVAHPQGQVSVVLHAPMTLDHGQTRKDLAARLEAQVRAGLEAGLEDQAVRAADTARKTAIGSS